VGLIKIHHPDSPRANTYAEVTEEAFVEVWEPKGWTMVDDDVMTMDADGNPAMGVAMSPEEAAPITGVTPAEAAQEARDQAALSEAAGVDATDEDPKGKRGSK
jgi:hypothetical protein